jgi:hypothetical protein
MTTTYVNDLPFYHNREVCPRCGAPWQVVEVLHMLDGSTKPAPPDFGLLYCPCVEQPAPQPLRYIQARLF